MAPRVTRAAAKKLKDTGNAALAEKAQITNEEHHVEDGEVAPLTAQTTQFAQPTASTQFAVSTFSTQSAEFQAPAFGELKPCHLRPSPFGQSAEFQAPAFGELKPCHLRPSGQSAEIQSIAFGDLQPAQIRSFMSALQSAQLEPTPSRELRPDLLCSSLWGRLL